MLHTCLQSLKYLRSFKTFILSNKKKGSGPKKAKNRIKKDLLSFLKSNAGQPFNFKQLRTKLHVNSTVDLNFLENAITFYIKEKIIEIEGRGKVKYPKPEAPAIIGKVDMTRNGAAFIISDQLEQDIYISAKNKLNAFNGDIVEVKLFNTGKGKRPEGEIVKVKQRAKTQFVCTIEVSEKFAFANPDDKKMDMDFFVPPSKLGGAKDGEKVLIRLINYNPEEKSPVGEVIAVLGKPGEHDTEMQAIMMEHNINSTFDKRVGISADSIPAEITSEEIAKREDFRGVTTFTIDPFDAKDFDDALSYRVIDKDITEVGIHIADVTHYVRSGTVVDAEAKKRATSVYLVDRVIPMLPERLSNDLCSLRPNEDKLCFSAVFHINSNGTVVQKWFGRTVIHSDRRFSYEEAQERIESQEGDFANEIIHLNTLAKKLRAKRFKEGAISFDREEVKFKLDDKGFPLEIIPKKSLDAHKLIEEFMLLANKLVAENYQKGLKGKKAPFVYRVHAKPDPKKLNGFQQMAARFGYKLDITNLDSLSKQINQLLADSADKPEHNMLSTLAIRTMAKAAYTTKNIGHYGLAFKDYTHFTSPIRRYPDVMVHRLLAQYLDGNAKADQEELEALCKHSSEMEKQAEEAERDSIKYKQVEYMSQFVGKAFEGIVSGVTEHTLFVELDNKCEGGIRLNSMLDDNYSFDELNYRIVGFNKRKTYSLGDRVKVRIQNCDLSRRIIDMDMIGSIAKKGIEA